MLDHLIDLSTKVGVFYLLVTEVKNINLMGSGKFCIRNLLCYHCHQVAGKIFNLRNTSRKRLKNAIRSPEYCNSVSGPGDRITHFPVESFLRKNIICALFYFISTYSSFLSATFNE